jgi:hypothetical protein
MPQDEDYVLATAKLEKLACHSAKNWGVGTSLFSNVSHYRGIVRKQRHSSVAVEAWTWVVDMNYRPLVQKGFRFRSTLAESCGSTTGLGIEVVGGCETKFRRRLCRMIPGTGKSFGHHVSQKSAKSWSRPPTTLLQGNGGVTCDSHPLPAFVPSDRPPERLFRGACTLGLGGLPGSPYLGRKTVPGRWSVSWPRYA